MQLTQNTQARLSDNFISQYSIWYVAMFIVKIHYEHKKIHLRNFFFFLHESFAI